MNQSEAIAKLREAGFSVLISSIVQNEFRTIIPVCKGPVDKVKYGTLHIFPGEEMRKTQWKIDKLKRAFG